MKRTAILIILTALMLSCRTVPIDIPEDLAPREYFQLAQEAVVERNDYDTALRYYTTFVSRYPDDLQNGVQAEYEIAFIYYKKNDLERSKALFEELLETYRTEGAESLPRWPQVLAVQILEKIDRKLSSSEEDA